MSTISELENLCGPGKPLRHEPVDASHDARNLTEYEGGLEISERLVDDLINATQKVANLLD